MNQQLPPDDTEEARLLLPWYITGKLSDLEKQQVETALARDADLQADYDRELQMVGMIRKNASLLELVAVDTTNQRLDKLLKRIERTETATESRNQPVQPSRPQTASKPSFLQRLREWFDDSWRTPANTVFASLLAIQIGVVGWLIYLNSNSHETIYTSASVVENDTPALPHNGMIFLVDFKDDVAVRQIREFLLKWNAHIIGGPDANNLFRIEIHNIPNADKRSELILQKIQQDQSISNFIGREF